MHSSTPYLEATGSATTSRGRSIRLFAAAVAAAALLAGCGTVSRGRAVTTDDGVSTSPATAAAVAARPVTSTVARARTQIEVHERPRDDAPSRSLPATTGFGSPTVLLVSKVGTGRRAGWLKVLLPVRPNGAVGWIRARDVDLDDVALEVRIDLAARELTLLDGGEKVLRTAAAIGQPGNPTPTGRFFVVDKLETREPAGAYGPYALGLSAHSEVLTEFAGGDGQIGVHGTNRPDSIGRAVSHGCVRVDNAVITRLARLLPLGTPVTIV
jgi:hypothetical protein